MAGRLALAWVVGFSLALAAAGIHDVGVDALPFCSLVGGVVLVLRGAVEVSRSRGCRDGAAR